MKIGTTLKDLRKEMVANRKWNNNGKVYPKGKEPLSSLIYWARAIRCGNYSDEIMTEAFEKYVDTEDYHPSEKKKLTNYSKLKRTI